MSWSISLIGNPQKVIDALNEQSEKLTGQSKLEYDAALPSLRSLVAENFAPVQPVIKITANGHGYENGQADKSTRNCSVSIETVYGLLV